MSQKYGRVVAGAFTAIRYTEAGLRFGNTIADIIATGDQILPIIEALPNTGTEEAPVFRAPTVRELANAVVNEDSLATPIYERDLGIANGAATLDADGDVLATQIPDEVVEYLGTWDPTTNTPTLADGVGNIGDSYKVDDAVGDEDYSIDLGTGPINVRGGMTVIFRAELGDEANGTWYVSGASGLSNDDRFLLENSLQKIKTYDLKCVPAAINVTQGEVALAQVESANNPYPEYTLESDAGLAGVTLNALSGELRIDTGADVAGNYTVQVVVGGNLGQSDAFDIPVVIS